MFPDLVGMNARDAARTLARLGVSPRLHGSGTVVSQRPAAGSALDVEDSATLWLERRPPPQKPAEEMPPLATGTGGVSRGTTVTVGELLRAFARAMPPQDRPAHVSDARSLEVECMGVAYDSRRVTPGMVFVAVPGLKADGLQFVPQAIAAGAAAIVTEQPATGVPVPWVVVTSARLALALLAAEFFEHPSRAMRVVGITGTNGKTTTSYLTAAILEAAGVRCGMMGTVMYRIGARSIDATRTTPEAPELQSFMRRMVTKGAARA